MIEEFLATYPFLRGDQGYINYLETYAGASVIDAGEEDRVMLDIAGFTQVSTNLATWDFEVPVVDEEGYYSFASGVYTLSDRGMHYDGISIGGCFDSTGTRKWGVYRSVQGSTPEEFTRYWYCDTFEEWLWAILEYKGRLPDHLHE